MTTEELYSTAHKICYAHHRRWMDELGTFLMLCSKHNNAALCASQRSQNAYQAYLGSKEVLDVIASTTNQ
jgi:hypothetical protein